MSLVIWWFASGDTPLPIPNREVKSARGDDTRFAGKVVNRQFTGLFCWKIFYNKKPR